MIVVHVRIRRLDRVVRRDLGHQGYPLPFRAVAGRLRRMPGGVRGRPPPRGLSLYRAGLVQPGRGRAARQPTLPQAEAVGVGCEDPSMGEAVVLCAALEGMP